MQIFHVWSRGMGVSQIDRPGKQMSLHISIAEHTHILLGQACISRAVVASRISAGRSEPTV